MLPICPLDGYKIMKLVSEIFVPFKYTFYILISINIVLLIYIIFRDFTLFKTNIFIFLFLLFMTLDEIKNKKYIINRFYLERMTRNFNYPIKKIGNYKKMYKNRVHYIKNVHEKDYLRELFTYE